MSHFIHLNVIITTIATNIGLSPSCKLFTADAHHGARSLPFCKQLARWAAVTQLRKEGVSPPLVGKTGKSSEFDAEPPFVSDEGFTNVFVSRFFRGVK